MNALRKLENVQGNKPYHGFAKLTIGNHLVEGFRYVKNKFAKKGEGNAKSILCELKDQIVFLPQFFSQTLKETDIDELNESRGAIYLYFGGRQEGSK